MTNYVAVIRRPIREQRKWSISHLKDSQHFHNLNLNGSVPIISNNYFKDMKQQPGRAAHPSSVPSDDDQCEMKTNAQNANYKH